MVFRHCDRRLQKEITSEELKPGEKTAVIVSGDSITVVAAPNGLKHGAGIRAPKLRGRESESKGIPGTVVQRIDGARGVRISVSDSGTVSVIARTRGFCFEPGFGGYTTAEYRRLFVDAQLMFNRRHGINVGLGFGLRGRLQPSAFVAYSYKFYGNTSALIGMDTKKQILIGLRVEF
jgi:hypothetical protein